jgi:hypothetical protein
MPPREKKAATVKPKKASPASKPAAKGKKGKAKAKKKAARRPRRPIPNPFTSIKDKYLKLTTPAPGTEGKPFLDRYWPTRKNIPTIRPAVAGVAYTAAVVNLVWAFILIYSSTWADSYDADHLEGGCCATGII